MKSENILIEMVKEVDKLLFVDVVNVGTKTNHMPSHRIISDRKRFAKSSIDVVKLNCSQRIADFEKELEIFA